MPVYNLLEQLKTFVLRNTLKQSTISSAGINAGFHPSHLLRLLNDYMRELELNYSSILDDTDGCSVIRVLGDTGVSYI